MVVSAAIRFFASASLGAASLAKGHRKQVGFGEVWEVPFGLAAILPRAAGEAWLEIEACENGRPRPARGVLAAIGAIGVARPLVASRSES